MNFSRRTLFGLLTAPLLMLLTGTALASTGDPKAVIQELVDSVTADLDNNIDDYRQNPTALRALVDTNLRRFADLDIFTRLVLAKYWREANEDQITRFQKAFEDYLMQQYGSAILSYQGGKVAVSDAIMDDKRGRATVPTVFSGGGVSAKVDYKLIDRDETGEWRIYDVILEGLSVVQNFRNSFQDTLSRDGIDRLIELLEQKNDDFAKGVGANG